MMKKQYSFSNIKFKDLREVVSLSPDVDEKLFSKWFDYDYELSEFETAFFENLVKQHQVKIRRYSEEDLKMKFISPILNAVNFNIGNKVSDFYERVIGAEVNGVYLSGVTDYMVAKGFGEPDLPYFFIQEFKPSNPSGDPENQLLAELIVALELNQGSEILGVFIVGQLWTFVLLQKISNNSFQYFISSSFDTIKIEDLKKLYIALQGVKADIKQKVGLDD